MDIKFEVIKKIAETKFKYRNLKSVSKLDSSSPPSVFIGSGLKYPAVNVGILSPLYKEEKAWIYDDPKYWAEKSFGIREVLNLRNSLLNSRFRSAVSMPRLASSVSSVNSRAGRKFIELAQEIALASKPVNVEIELKRKINPERRADKIITPHGLKGELKKARIVGNVKIPLKIDKVINDDIKASDAVTQLYKSNFSEYALSKILSIGVLGLKKQRKLVPTRWSITATDDIIGKNLINNIKDFKCIEQYELFFGEFMGNCYLIMLFPSVWSYELFEIYMPGSSWNPSTSFKASTDYEWYSGRKDYAYSTAGGYYATRLPILEHLNKIKRQASVLVIRIETPGYWAAMGVWVVRESVRKALNNRVLKFNSLKELEESSRKISMIKFNFDISHLLAKSKLLKHLKTQTSLEKWF